MSFIENIEIKNFKSIRHAKIEGCKRINVFIGAPNVGKSNILEALSLFCYSKDTSHILLKDLIRYNELTELFFDGNINKQISMVLSDHSELFDKELARLNLQYEENDELTLSITSPNENQPLNNRLSHKIGFDIQKSGTVNVNVYKGLNQKHFNGLNIKRYTFSKEEFNKSESAKRLSFPKGNNLFQVISNNTEIKKIAGELFRKYKLKIYIDKSIGDFRIVKQVDDDVLFPIPFGQIADTMQRLLFYLTAIITNDNTILIFEEPESHMYSPYISKFNSQMMYDKNNNQFFLATHSPYVISDLMEQVKEEISIYICSYVNGETMIKRMNDEEMHEAAQFGYDFFMNLENFVKD